MDNENKVIRDWMYYERLFGKISVYLLLIAILSYIIFLSFLETLRFYADEIAYPLLGLFFASGISFFIALGRIIKYSIKRNELPEDATVGRSVRTLFLSPIAFGAYYILFFIVAFSSCGT